MDHRSADTTSAYYGVEKDEACGDGHVAGPRGGSAWQSRADGFSDSLRSAVGRGAWGNCVEPSNVKAGGNACPIRFQCPGCSSYRPDPSHLPSIEDQIRSLTANLEVARAMGAAAFIIKGLEGEIADYQNEVTTMKAKLAAMTDEERGEVEEASKIRRRLRSGAAVSG